MNPGEHITSQDRVNSLKITARRKDVGPLDNDTRSKGSYGSIERRKGKGKQVSPLRSTKKGMYHTVNDGFFKR